jgi:hypothetical protein
MIALIALLQALSHPYPGLATEETDERTSSPVSPCLSEELATSEVVQSDLAVPNRTGISSRHRSDHHAAH